MKLNLGCGSNIIQGYLNCDNFSSDRSINHANIIYVNLNVFPWPFPNDYADEILMNHVLEHLPDTTSVLNEVKRILKSGGIFHGQVPYGPSKHGYSHWQHCRYFIDSSFIQMADDFGFKVIIVKNKCFDSSIKWYNWMYFCRNLVPFKKYLAKLGWSEAYDVVDFKLKKLAGE